MRGLSCVFTDRTCAILSSYLYDNMTELYLCVYWRNLCYFKQLFIW